MNNYIDERFIPYGRTQTNVKRCVRIENSRKNSKKVGSGGILIESLRFLAAIFLLLLSTFGRTEGEGRGKDMIKAEKIVKNFLCYCGIALALWAMLVVLSNIINAVTLLPTWSLILIFAATLLTTAGVLKK